MIRKGITVALILAAVTLAFAAEQTLKIDTYTHQIVAPPSSPGASYDIQFGSLTTDIGGGPGGGVTSLTATAPVVVTPSPIIATGVISITGSALTKSDDTNVTLTLGGTPTTALLQATSLTLGWTGQLAVTRGGTGLGTIAQGDLLYGSASNTLSALSKNTSATRYLSNTGPANSPAWAQVNLADGVTGDLPFTNLAQIASGRNLGRRTTATGDIEQLFPLVTINVKDPPYNATGDGATDDTTAIQTAITDAWNAGGGTIFFPAGTYLVNGAFDGTTNSILKIPKNIFSDPAKVIELRGETGSAFPSWGDLGVGGSIIKTTKAGTGTRPALLATAAYVGEGTLATNDFNYTVLYIRDLQFKLYVNPSIDGLRLGESAWASLENVNVFASSGGEPTFGTRGIWMPNSNNFGVSYCDKTLVSGFGVGYQIGEHWVASNATAAYCLLGLKVAGGYHLSSGDMVLQECKEHISFIGTHPVDFTVDFEDGNAALWYDTTANVVDASNFGYGIIRYHRIVQGVGYTTTPLVVTGGAGLNFVNLFTGTSSSSQISTTASSASAKLDDIKITAQTATVTGTTGITTATGFNKFAIYRPTYTDSSSVTVDRGATLWIENAPLAAGSLTLTNPYALWVDAGTTRLDGILEIGSTITFPDNVRQTFNPGADAAGLNVGSIAGDPGTPSNGDLWYDSTANELTARINGASVALGAGGVSTFLGLSDTPSSYSGQAGKALRVNVGETALEFFTAAGSGTVTQIDVDSPIVATPDPITTTGTLSLNVGVDHAFTAAQSVSLNDGEVSTFSDLLTLRHTSTGTVLADFGASLRTELEDASGTTQFAHDMIVAWSDPATSTRTSYISWRLANSGVNGHKMRLFGSGGLSVNSTTDPGAGQINANTGFKIANAALNFSHLAGDFALTQTPSAAADKLIGRGNGGGAGDWQEITLGTNLSMSGTTLNATGGGGLTVGTTAITSGTGGRVLYETSGNVLGEISNFTSDGTNTTIAATGKMTIGDVELNSTQAAFDNDLTVRNKTADTNTTFRVMPRGTVANTPSAFEFFGTDFIADSTNYERLSIRSRGSTAPSTYRIFTDAGGSGTVRDITINTSGTETNQFRVFVSGGVGVDTATSPGAGTFAVGNGATSAGKIQINEDTDDGAHKATFTVPALAADTAYILPPDDGDAGEQLQTNGSGTLTWEPAGSGAPSDADYLVGTANGTLSAEIVVGTSPGGELGGSWASPTIDDSVAVTSWNLTTPTLTGAATLAESASVHLDEALTTGNWSGITITGVSGFAQTYGDLVYLDDTTSRWEECDANAAAAADGDSRRMLGIVVVTGTDGNACTILLQGTVRADTQFPTFTAGAPLYVSETAGEVTQTQPTTADVVIRVVGYGLAQADTMYFNPSGTWTTHL